MTSKYSAFISSALGSHQTNKSNDDVLSFHMERKNVQNFPKGLEKIFKNLIRIGIKFCSLQEVTQDDLKPFPKLVTLALYDNKIEVLEAGTFAHNKNLQIVDLQNNSLVHIDADVFGELSHLKLLLIASSLCVNMNAVNNFDEYNEVIKRINHNCTNSRFLELTSALVGLEDEFKHLEFEDFKEFKSKVEDLEKNFGKSSFIKLPSIKVRIQDLKNFNNQAVWIVREQAKKLEEKLSSENAELRLQNQEYLRKLEEFEVMLVKNDKNLDELKTKGNWFSFPNNMWLLASSSIIGFTQIFVLIIVYKKLM